MCSERCELQWLETRKKMSSKRRYTLVDEEENFEAIPNGHKSFLTPTALEKINVGREEAVFYEEHPLMPTSGPLVDVPMAQYPRNQSSLNLSRPQRPPPPLVGESVFPEGAPGGRGRRYGRYGRGRGGGSSVPGATTVGVWFRTLGSGNNNNFNQSRRGRGRGRSSRRNNQDTQEEENHDIRSLLFDHRSTSIQEAPTMAGDVSDGIMTMRLRAFSGKQINVSPGQVITLTVRGQGGPLRGQSVSLEVKDIIYGANAYVNLLVDGGTVATTGRSHSRKNAYARVVLI